MCAWPQRRSSLPQAPKEYESLAPNSGYQLFEGRRRRRSFLIVPKLLDQHAIQSIHRIFGHSSVGEILKAS